MSKRSCSASSRWISNSRPETSRVDCAPKLSFALTFSVYSRGVRGYPRLRRQRQPQTPPPNLLTATSWPSALVGLALGEPLGDPVGAAAALHSPRELGVPVADLGQESLAARCDRDLAAVAADRAGDGLRDLSRRGRAHAGWRLGTGVGEHPGLAHEARGDNRDPDALRIEILSEPEREPPKAELRRVVDGCAWRADLAGEGGDEDQVTLAALGQPWGERPSHRDRGLEVDPQRPR